MTSMIVINAILWIAASAALAVFMYAPLRVLDDRPSTIASELRVEYRQAA